MTQGLNTPGLNPDTKKKVQRKNVKGKLGPRNGKIGIPVSWNQSLALAESLTPEGDQKGSKASVEGPKV